MFIRQLEYLIALSQLQHFSRAAQHCNVSQPSLSSAIKQLEDELGTLIVLRHQRFHGLTPEGQRIVEWAKRIVADRNAMLQELAVLQRNLCGQLRLGVMPTSSPILPFITKQFTKRHPGVRIHVNFLGLDDMRVKLMNFELDAGIAYTDQKPPVPLTTYPLYREHLGLLVPNNRTFPAGESITWAEAADLPLCLLPANMQERQIIDAAFAAAGKTPTPGIESDSIVNLAFHAMHGSCATIIPDHFAQVIGAFPNTRVMRLVEPDIVREVGLVWVEGDPILPMAGAIFSLLKSMLESGELKRLLRQRELSHAETK